MRLLLVPYFICLKIQASKLKKGGGIDLIISKQQSDLM
jgi:hypothetical protein